MAAMIVILAGAALWLEVLAMRVLHQTSMHAPGSDNDTPRDAPVEALVARAAIEITALLDLQACWYEPFPFDTLLPRIEDGRIVLPVPEPGVAPWSDAGGVELPVRSNGLSVGRFVLQCGAATVGVRFPPSARDRAIAIAGQVGPAIATALTGGPGEKPWVPRYE
jgi:hypothetical protein